MAQFADLPAELLTKCAEALTTAPKPNSHPATNLLNLACTCKQFCEVVIPVLYRSFALDTLGRRDDIVLAAYIRSLAIHEHLLQYIRRIDLHNYAWSARHGVWQKIDLETDSLVWSPDTLGQFLCSRAQNLHDLDIEYPLDGTFLSFHSLSIERLRVRPTFNPWQGPEPRSSESDQYPIEGMLSLNFLKSVLSWPNLQELRLEATSTFQDPTELSDDDVLHGSTQLSRLILKLGNLDIQSLLILTERSSALAEFSYLPPTSGDVSEEWDLGSYSENLPITSEIITALRKHVATLESMTIGRAGSFWDSRYEHVGSLVDFQVLKFLQIDIAMLSGWEHCSHILDSYEIEDGIAPTFFPSMLGSLLPTSLEQLVLLAETGPHANLDHNLAIIALSVATEARSGYLKNLTRVQILPSKCAYCLECDRQGTSQAAMIAGRGLSESTEELNGAQRTLAQLGILLTF